MKSQEKDLRVRQAEVKDLRGRQLHNKMHQRKMTSKDNFSGGQKFHKDDLKGIQPAQQEDAIKRIFKIKVNIKEQIPNNNFLVAHALMGNEITL